MQTAIQTFQPAQTNQLAAAIALQLASIPPGSPTATQECTSLLESLAAAAAQAVSTSGYVCEALGVAALIASARSHDLGRDAISAGSILLETLLLPPSVDGGGSVSSTCLQLATITAGGFLRALWRDESAAGTKASLALINVVQNCVGLFTLRTLAGAAPGERRSATTAGSLVIFAARVAIDVPESNSISAGTVTLVLPPISARAPSAVVTVPLTSVGAAAAAMGWNGDHPFAVLDIAGQTLAVVPGSFCTGTGSFKFISGAASVSLSISTGTSAALPAELLSNLGPDLVLIMLPVSPSVPAGNTVVCVAWNGTKYITAGCAVWAISTDGSAVTCACTQLALVAVVLAESVAGNSMNSSLSLTASSLTEYTTKAQENSTSSPAPTSRFPQRNKAAIAAALAAAAVADSPQPSPAAPSSDWSVLEAANDRLGNGRQMSPLIAYATAGVGVLCLGVIVVSVNRLRIAWRYARKDWAAKKQTEFRPSRRILSRILETPDIDAETVADSNMLEHSRERASQCVETAAGLCLQTDLVILHSNSEVTCIPDASRPLGCLGPRGFTSSAPFSSVMQEDEEVLFSGSLCLPLRRMTSRQHQEQLVLRPPLVLQSNSPATVSAQLMVAGTRPASRAGSQYHEQNLEFRPSLPLPVDPFTAISQHQE